MKKLIFLCFQDTECNSTQKEINFQFLSKKEYPFDPCTYRGFLFLHFFHCFLKFCVFRIPYVIILKMRRILYFLVTGSDFRPSWCQVMQCNYTQKCIFFKIAKFFEDFVIFLSFHFTEWHSSQKEVIFWKNSTRFAGFLAVVFTSQ